MSTSSTAPPAHVRGQNEEADLIVGINQHLTRSTTSNVVELFRRCRQTTASNKTRGQWRSLPHAAAAKRRAIIRPRLRRHNPSSPSDQRPWRNIRPYTLARFQLAEGLMLWARLSQASRPPTEHQQNHRSPNLGAPSEDSQLHQRALGENTPISIYN